MNCQCDVQAAYGSVGERQANVPSVGILRVFYADAVVHSAEICEGGKRDRKEQRQGCKGADLSVPFQKYNNPPATCNTHIRGLQASQHYSTPARDDP